MTLTVIAVGFINYVREMCLTIGFIEIASGQKQAGTNNRKEKNLKKKKKKKKKRKKNPFVLI